MKSKYFNQSLRLQIVTNLEMRDLNWSMINAMIRAIRLLPEFCPARSSFDGSRTSCSPSWRPAVRQTRSCCDRLRQEVDGPEPAFFCWKRQFKRQAPKQRFLTVRTSTTRHLLALQCFIVIIYSGLSKCLCQRLERIHLHWDWDSTT